MSASEKMASKAIRVVLFNLDETGSEGAGALWNSCPIIGAVGEALRRCCVVRIT